MEPRDAATLDLFGTRLVRAALLVVVVVVPTLAGGCGGKADCVVETRYHDLDGDGFGGRSLTGCFAPSATSWIEVSGDCHDDDPAAHPGAFERCNAQDDDCDRQTDEDLPGPWYADADGDGWGDALDVADLCLPGRVHTPGDCDDDAPNRSPTGAEVCDGLDNDCDGFVDEADEPRYADADHDNHGDRTQPLGVCGVLLGDDCDDTDRDVRPGAVESCDGVDNDCDGVIDGVGPWYADDDDDGWGDPGAPQWTCSGGVSLAGDCDDTDRDVHPADGPCTVRGQNCDLCDGVDTDCDGRVDEDAAAVAWIDADGDGFGDPLLGACAEADGLVTVAGDCADTDPERFPGALERCDGVDQDCDGVVDGGPWVADRDGDGFGDATDPGGSECGEGLTSDRSDCDDADPDRSPSASERCNSLDDDCDGRVDEDPVDAAAIWFADADGDGFGDPSLAFGSCGGPVPGAVANDADCDDGRATTFPGATEYCNGRDDDCDGDIDVIGDDVCVDGHGTEVFEPTDTEGWYCSGGAQVHYTYFGELTYDECERLANRTATQWYVGISTDYTVGWIGADDDASAARTSRFSWQDETIVDRDTLASCVLGQFEHRTEPTVSPAEESYTDDEGRHWVFWRLTRQTHSQAIAFADDRGARIINGDQVGLVGERSMTAPTHWCHAGAEFNGSGQCNTDDRCDFIVGYWE